MPYEVIRCGLWFRRMHELALADSAQTIEQERGKLAEAKEEAAAEAQRYAELESKLQGIETELSASHQQLQQHGDALRDAEADKRALQATIDEQALQHKHEATQAAATLSREEEKYAKVGAWAAFILLFQPLHLVESI